MRTARNKPRARGLVGAAAQATRLAHENMVLAEIGRIISSSLDIQEVYEGFAQQVRKLLPCDRTVIDLLNEEKGSLTIAYVSGLPVDRFPKGAEIPLQGTALERIVQTRSSMLISAETLEEVVAYPGLVPAFQAGIRTFLSVPLISRTRVIGALSLRRTKANAYSPEDVELAERIAGQIAGAVANSQLYARLKRTEEALRRQELEMATLTDNLPAVVSRFDREMRYVYVNQAAERLTGLAREQLLGKTPWEAGLPENAARVMEEGLQEVLVTGKPATVEFYIPTQRGIKYFRSLRVPEFGDNGQVQFVLGIALDVTDQVLARQALKESEELYRTLIDTSPDAITLTDPQSRVVLANRQAVQLHGFDSADEVIGKSAFDLIAPEDRQRAMENARRTLETGAIKNVEYTLLKKDGTRFPGELSASLVLDAAGKPKGFIAVVRDVTERKLMQDRERKAQLQFLSALAHEIRNPLTPMLSSAGMLGELLGTAPDSIHGRLLANLINGAQILKTRVDELLDVAAFEAGALRLDLAWLDPKQALEEIYDFMRPEAERRGQKLALEVPVHLPTVRADKRRFRQVVENLMLNAMKFSPEGRPITVRARAEDRCLVVEVEDRGRGISQEEQKRLFQPYFRTEQDRQRFHGLGIGLALSRQIVEAHGGRIWVKSRPGDGATFTFTLPCSTRRHPSHKPPSH